MTIVYAAAATHPLIRPWMKKGQRVLAPLHLAWDYSYARIEAVEPVLGSFVLRTEVFMAPSGPRPERLVLVTGDDIARYFPIDEAGQPIDQSGSGNV